MRCSPWGPDAARCATAAGRIYHPDRDRRKDAPHGSDRFDARPVRSYAGPRGPPVSGPNRAGGQPNVTASEFAFLALGLVLGVAAGAALVEVARSRPSAPREVRVTASDRGRARSPMGVRPTARTVPPAVDQPIAAGSIVTRTSRRTDLLIRLQADPPRRPRLPQGRSTRQMRQESRPNISRGAERPFPSSCSRRAPGRAARSWRCPRPSSLDRRPISSELRPGPGGLRKGSRLPMRRIR